MKDTVVEDSNVTIERFFDRRSPQYIGDCCRNLTINSCDPIQLRLTIQLRYCGLQLVNYRLFHICFQFQKPFLARTTHTQWFQKQQLFAFP